MRVPAEASNSAPKKMSSRPVTSCSLMSGSWLKVRCQSRALSTGGRNSGGEGDIPGRGASEWCYLTIPRQAVASRLAFFLPPAAGYEEVARALEAGPGVRELEQMIAVIHNGLESGNGLARFLPVFEMHMVEGGYGAGRMRPDYEAAVAAFLDALDGAPGLDLDRVGLAGVSLGGHYAPRAAA